jgi:LAO/AO transport system kinase
MRGVGPHSGDAIRIGITGAPGAGKSTFIEAFGLHLIAAGHRVATLAVDPSSPRSGGSILGDKTRMEKLARHPDAFVRPSPSGGTMGGVARRSREAILLCEAAGFDVVLVETVGSGQSETAVAGLVDLFVLLVAPGSGDELQGLKKGIVELADIVVITKADGELAAAAAKARGDYEAALGLLAPASADWRPPVLQVSALEGGGVDAVWNAIEEFRSAHSGSGGIARRRAEQARGWMWDAVEEGLAARLRRDRTGRDRLAEIEAEVEAGRRSPNDAAAEILNRLLRDPD